MLTIKRVQYENDIGIAYFTVEGRTMENELTFDIKNDKILKIVSNDDEFGNYVSFYTPFVLRHLRERNPNQRTYMWY